MSRYRERKIGKKKRNGGKKKKIPTKGSINARRGFFSSVIVSPKTKKKGGLDMIIDKPSYLTDEDEEYVEYRFLKELFRREKERSLRNSVSERRKSKNRKKKTKGRKDISSIVKTLPNYAKNFGWETKLEKARKGGWGNRGGAINFFGDIEDDGFDEIPDFDIKEFEKIVKRKILLMKAAQLNHSPKSKNKKNTPTRKLVNILLREEEVLSDLRSQLNLDDISPRKISRQQKKRNRKVTRRLKLFEKLKKELSENNNDPAFLEQISKLEAIEKKMKSEERSLESINKKLLLEKLSFVKRNMGNYSDGGMGSGKGRGKGRGGGGMGSGKGRGGGGSNTRYGDGDSSDGEGKLFLELSDRDNPNLITELKKKRKKRGKKGGGKKNRRISLSSLRDLESRLASGKSSIQLLNMSLDGKLKDMSLDDILSQKDFELKEFEKKLLEKESELKKIEDGEKKEMTEEEKKKKEEEEKKKREEEEEMRKNVAPPPPPPPPPGLDGDIFSGMGGPPPPPPPPGGLKMVGSPGGDDLSSPLPVLPEKNFETVNIRVGVIPKRRLSKTVFKKDNLLEKGTKQFWKDSMKNLLEEKFQKKKKKKKKEGEEDDENISKKDPEKIPLVNAQKSMNASIVCSKLENKEKIINSLNKSEEWIYATPEGQETLSRIGQICTMFSPEERKMIISRSKEEEKKKKEREEEEERKKKEKEEEEQEGEGEGEEKKKKKEILSTTTTSVIKNQFSEGDQFIMRLLTEVPCLDTKLQIYEFLDSYKNVIFEQVKPELEVHNKFCKALKDSEKFRQFLSLVLVITNFLNQSAAPLPTSTNDEEKEKEEEEEEEEEIKKKISPKKKKKKNVVHLGISVRSLLNLSRVKNPENSSESLMDVVYQIILSDDPSLLDFRKQFEGCHEVVQHTELKEKRDALKVFSDKVSKQNNFLNKLIKQRDSKVLDPEDNIILILEDLLPSLEKEIEEIEKTICEAEKLVEEICDHFGHNKDGICEFFLTLKDFLLLLGKTEEKHERNEKKKKRAEIREQRKKERMLRKQKKLEEKMKKLQELEEPKSPAVKFTSLFANKFANKGGRFSARKAWGSIINTARVKVRKEAKVSALMKWRNLIGQLVMNSNQEFGEKDPAKQWKLLKGMIKGNYSSNFDSAEKDDEVEEEEEEKEKKIIIKNEEEKEGEN